MTASHIVSLQRSAGSAIVRGELSELSEAERTEALQSSMSYYPDDLLVVGWIAALVYKAPEGAAPSIELLEYMPTPTAGISAL
jgi:hypothetical protein